MTSVNKKCDKLKKSVKTFIIERNLNKRKFSPFSVSFCIFDCYLGYSNILFRVHQGPFDWYGPWSFINDWLKVWSPSAPDSGSEIIATSLLCPYFRQSEIRTPFDSTQYQRLKYEHSSDTTMFVCVRIFVEFVFQSHPASNHFRLLTKLLLLRIVKL